MKRKLCLIFVFSLFFSGFGWSSEKPEFNQAQWESLSELEKQIAVLTCPWMEQYSIDYCDFETDGKAILLNDWKINNEADLLKVFEDDKRNSDGVQFLHYKDYLNSSPDKTPAQIATDKKLSMQSTMGLFYCYDTRTKLGRHGLEAYPLARQLLLLRLAAGSGLMEKQKALKYAETLVERALNDYVSLEDFAGHFIASRYEDAQALLNAWESAIECLPVDQINFNGSNADKNAIMKISDGAYEPSEYTAPFVQIYKTYNSGFTSLTQGMAMVNECLDFYGVLSCLKTILTLTNLKMNRELWDSLPEFEQFAIACSSNVFERNKQYHLDFNNRVLFNKNTTEGYEILNENWGIYNTEELLQSYKELAEGEQGALYNRLKALLEKYPDLTVLEIAEKERLTVTETSRMYFVEDMREALGVHGLQAWLDARKIAILRWGIGAGYITREQAVELIVPIVERIKNDYKNYEEFIAHFIAGYCFNAVYDSNCPDCAEKLISAVSSARKYIPFDTLPFTGINADKNYTMQIDDATYYPSITALKLDPIQKLYKKSSNENVLEQLDEEVEKYPEAQTLVIPFKLRQLYNYASASKVIDYIHANKEYIDSYPKESAGYTELATIYMVDLIKVFRPEEAIALYNSLPESLQKEEGYYYSYGYANYQLSFLCSTVLERDIYIRRAKTVFERLLARNYDLGESVQNWLEAVE